MSQNLFRKCGECIQTNEKHFQNFLQCMQLTSLYDTDANSHLLHITILPTYAECKTLSQSVLKLALFPFLTNP